MGKLLSLIHLQGKLNLGRWPAFIPQPLHLDRQGLDPRREGRLDGRILYRHIALDQLDLIDAELEWRRRLRRRGRRLRGFGVFRRRGRRQQFEQIQSTVGGPLDRQHGMLDPHLPDMELATEEVRLSDLDPQAIELQDRHGAFVLNLQCGKGHRALKAHLRRPILGLAETQGQIRAQPRAGHFECRFEGQISEVWGEV